MKKKTKIIFLSILIVLVIGVLGLFAGFSYFIGNQVFANSTQLVTNEETKEVTDGFFQSYGMDYEKFKATYTVEPLSLTSTFDGHTIPADYIYAKEANKNNKTVVLVHGLGGNRFTNYPLAAFFLEEGYNVITYDQRSSNDNIAKYTTFGYWEKYDVIDCINYAKKQAPDQLLGIWGTSFGGATAGLALGYEDTAKDVDFVVMDCPVSSMEWMIASEMSGMDVGIPLSYMTWCGNMVNKMKLGFTYGDADVSAAVKDTKTPVLIINSEKDVVTPAFMGQDIYNAIQGEKKQLWTVTDSDHAMVWLDHNQEYRETVKTFIEKHSKISG